MAGNWGISVVASIVFLFALVLADCSQAQPQNGSGSDWPGFLGPGRDGKSSETGFDWDWKKRPPKLAWSRASPGGYGIGSVADGRYFHFDRDGDFERVLCLDATSGKELWKFVYPTGYRDMYGFDNGPRCSPVIDEDRVYLLGAEGMLHCLNVVSGEVVWKINTSRQFNVVPYFFGVGSTPIVHGNLLIAMIGGGPAHPGDDDRRIRIEAAKPDDCAIVAFDKLTGAVRYTAIDDLASYAAPVVVHVQDDAVGLVFCRSGLHGFDPSTGSHKWSFPWRSRKYESVNASTPVMFGNNVLITEAYGPGGAVLELSGEEPRVVWQDEPVRDQRLACHWCTPVVVDGFAYACHGEKTSEAELRCIDLATGETRWSEPGMGRLNLLYADGQLLCLEEYGSLLVVRADPEKFQLTTEYVPPDGGPGIAAPCFAAPILSQGRLLFRDANQVYCYELPKLEAK